MLSVVTLGLFGGLTTAVVSAGMPYFGSDVAVSQAVQAAGWPGLEPAMRGVSLAGDHVLFSSVLVGGACLVLLHLRARREAAILLAVVLVGQVIKVGVKDLVGRPRPTAESVRVLIDAMEIYSFPSGHTVHYTVFFGFLWFLTFALVQSPARRWPLLAVWSAMVLTVGLARVYLGAHWATDVLGGYLLGTAVLAAGIGVYRGRS